MLLRDAFLARGSKTVFVWAAGRIPYGDVVRTMDVAKGAGAKRIGIVSRTTLAQARLGPRQ